MTLEKLIKETYNDMADFFGRLVVYPEIRVSDQERKRFVKHIITRISKAYADGLPLSNEARRTWLDEFEGYSEEKYGDYRVIILFPDDFYKEEKPNVTEDIDWLDGEDYGVK